MMLYPFGQCYSHQENVTLTLASVSAAAQDILKSLEIVLNVY